MCLTEGEWGISNGPISEQLSAIFTQATHRAKRGISPGAFGTTVMLQPFLRRAGYQNIQAQALYLEYSAGTEAHYSAYQDIMAAYKLLQPFFVSTEVTTQEELSQSMGRERIIIGRGAVGKEALTVYHKFNRESKGAR